jgi:hypothetical protein
MGYKSDRRPRKATIKSNPKKRPLEKDIDGNVRKKRHLEDNYFKLESELNSKYSKLDMNLYGKFLHSLLFTQYSFKRQFLLQREQRNRFCQTGAKGATQDNLSTSRNDLIGANSTLYFYLLIIER